MRKILALLAMMALAGCGGGGGGRHRPEPESPGSTNDRASQGDLVTPTFTLNLGTKSGSATQRNPKYINGTASKSVKITLISNNGTPTTVTNPSVTTNLNGGAGTTTCQGSCTVPGPPSPPGTDRYSVTTYDAAAGRRQRAVDRDQGLHHRRRLGEHRADHRALRHRQVVLDQRRSVAERGHDAGRHDAHRERARRGRRHDHRDVRRQQHRCRLHRRPRPERYAGNRLDQRDECDSARRSSPAGGATQNSTTSVTLHDSSDTVELHYAGLAENVKTITAAATGATNGTTTFQPMLQAITPASGTQIDLFVDSTTGGTGSTGGQTFTEAGFTGTYAQSFSSTFTMTSGYTTPCDQIATIAQSSPGVFTATAPAASKPPAAGKCDLTINDNLTQAGHTSTATTVVTYTTSSVGASSSTASSRSRSSCRRNPHRAGCGGSRRSVPGGGGEFFERIVIFSRCG